MPNNTCFILLLKQSIPYLEQMGTGTTFKEGFKGLNGTSFSDTSTGQYTNSVHSKNKSIYDIA